jgi:SAM-dependent methyltransferase
MIEQARRNAAGHADAARLAFEVGDVRALPFADASFDLVYTTRTLINLPTWDEQLAGLRECLRVCRPGGSVLLSEAFWEPFCQLNALRQLVRLPPLVEHDFNRYLKVSRLQAWLHEAGLAFDVDEFSSLYYLGSRVLRELVTDAAAWPGYSNPINAEFHAIETRYSGGGFGVQQAWIIRKPAGG